MLYFEGIYVEFERKENATFVLPTFELPTSITLFYD